MPAETVPQMMLLDYLREVGPQPLAEIALIAGISEATARRKLDGLVGQGLISVTPGRRGGGGGPRVYAPAHEIRCPAAMGAGAERCTCR